MREAASPHTGERHRTTRRRSRRRDRPAAGNGGLLAKVGNRNLSTAPLASPRPPSTTARIAPAQRAAREPTGTLHRHAACSPAARLHTAARSAHRAGVPPSGVSNSNPHHAPQSTSPRIVPRKVWREARCVTNHAHPSLARGCPRRQSSLARLRSPMWLRTAVSSRAASRRAPPQAQPSALAALALAATAANAAPTAGVASGCPSGQRLRYVRRPAARAFCGRCVSALTPFASVALRA